MTRKEIDKFYTDIVAQKIAEGYMITTKDDLCGHQGELGKIGFIKDNELYVVWINKERVDDDIYRWGGDRLVIRFSKWGYPADCNYTVWLSDLVTIDEYKFYQIDREGKWFTPDTQEFIDICEKRYQRIITDYTYNIKDITSDTTKEIAGNYMKRVQGYKRIS